MRPRPTLKTFAKVLLPAGLLLGLYGWQFGWQSPWRFDLAWDEEVRLHDQRIILVHFRRSYERAHLLSQAGSVHVATGISFDAGPPFGRFSHRFAPEDLALIDQHQQIWYFVAAPGSTGLQTPVFWTLQAGQSLQAAARSDSLPDAFTRWNVMPATPDAATLAKFDNTRLDLAQKLRHWAAHPRSDGAEVIRLGPQSAAVQAQK